MSWADRLENPGPLWQTVFWAPSRLYGAATALRTAAYERGWRETVRLPAPVFCLGNLTVGGSGKTPGVVWLVQYLQKRGRRPAVITRGYGRRGKDLRTVSDGGRVLLDVRQAGDEPLVLAARLPGVPVLAGADRAVAGRRALEDHGADCLVMDDGYQHLRLHRDLNLLCFDVFQDAALLEGPARLLPAGRLREPLAALGRAGVVFLTKADLAPETRLSALRRALTERAAGVPAAAVRYRLSFQDSPSGAAVPSEALRGSRVLALTGLARPAAFEESLRRLGADVASQRHPDHHFFTPEELDAARRRAAREERVVVVTEKDKIRLPADFACRVAALDWEPEEGDWIRRIDSVIA